MLDHKQTKPDECRLGEGMGAQHQAVQKGKRFHGTDDTADFRDRMTIRIEAGD